MVYISGYIHSDIDRRTFSKLKLEECVSQLNPNPGLEIVLASETKQFCLLI
jgi:hypothetical protein